MITNCNDSTKCNMKLDKLYRMANQFFDKGNTHINAWEKMNQPRCRIYAINHKTIAHSQWCVKLIWHFVQSIACELQKREREKLWVICMKFGSTFELWISRYVAEKCTFAVDFGVWMYGHNSATKIPWLSPVVCDQLQLSSLSRTRFFLIKRNE